MKMKFKYLFLFFVLSCGSFFTYAQDNGPIEMADGLRASGKIYVVVAVVVTILLGLFAYLIRIEKRISKLEKEIK